ncbi:DUF397 domain-containing protein [Streptomyces mobaraensis NBRC 13819 = DSM 40847]|uniref:DUF397 domain-containing protein n=2 Tax=Streptomyces mobaraensis TaxID=35621 RepID=A0A5N5W6M5_STRMB|nr:DUF397 domain-containing protein [Streptomyces mobaraensis]EME97828.1 hypothetical protein H340_24585 [Streptomyces mobaraensis NBRC 13819 = DSM 40847]KAB7843657.1 DUF397 domain-containing protein [Streptomyces mobaraensis]QTT76282.1 DUF397 domain-containing protein [Streptomyces mobaraensis NBRC 13819 = DSM 40847]
MTKNRHIVTEFKKASASQGPYQECVEVARTADGGRAIRDSRDREGPVLFFTAGEWAAFADGMAKGEFDDL